MGAADSAGNKTPDGGNDVIEHAKGQARIRADKESIVHNAVRAAHIPDHAERLRIVFFKLREGWLAHQVPTEKHAVADAAFVEMPRKLGAGECCIRFNQKQESEP